MVGLMNGWLSSIMLKKLQHGDNVAGVDSERISFILAIS